MLRNTKTRHIINNLKFLMLFNKRKKASIHNIKDFNRSVKWIEIYSVASSSLRRKTLKPHQQSFARHLSNSIFRSTGKALATCGVTTAVASVTLVLKQTMWLKGMIYYFDLIQCYCWKKRYYALIQEAKLSRFFMSLPEQLLGEFFKF